MPTYTRKELYTGVTASANIPASAQSFSLANDGGNVYFTIESLNDTFIFNNAVATSLTNCSVVSGSKNASFIIKEGTTATFTLTPSSIITKDNIRFIATNTSILSGSADEFFKGVTLSY